MTYLVSIVVFFCLILFQTTVIPALFDSANMYDLLIILIVYIGFFRTISESIPVILLLGVVMDCISGGAFGIYTTTYFWLYIIVAGVIQYLHVDSRFLLFIAIAAGVLWENIIILMTIVIKNFDLGFSTVYIKIIAAQIFWAVLTGPIVFYMIKTFHTLFETLAKNFFDSNSRKSDF